VFFDPNQVEEVGPIGFEPLPAGWYQVMIDSAAVKSTQSGGSRIAVQLAVVGQKRKLFCNFNTVNENPEAVRIGKGQFKRFCKAAGITESFNTSQDMSARLAGKTLHVLVGMTKNYKTGEPDNEVKDYNHEPKAPLVHGSTTVAVKPQPSGLMAEQDLPF